MTRRNPFEHTHDAEDHLADRLRSAEAETERLRTVLRSLISSGGTSPIIKSMAMNALEPGTGDAWLARRRGDR